MLADRRWIHLLSVNKPLFWCCCRGSKLVYIVWFAFNFVLSFSFFRLLISNPYYLENHFVLFLFLFCCLDGVRQSPRGRTREIAKGLH
jgi:hypothetical protein